MLLAMAGPAIPMVNSAAAATPAIPKAVFFVVLSRLPVSCWVRGCHWTQETARAVRRNLRVLRAEVGALCCSPDSHR